MALKMTDSQKVTLTIAPKTAQGKPAKLDGTPAWTSEDVGVATVEPATDGLSAVVKAVAAGNTTIRVEGDGDLGAGVTTLIGLLALEINNSPATVIDINTGTPEENV